MARYIREVQLGRPEDFVQYIVGDFLYKHGFALEEFKGQMVYRAGDGFFEIPKFLIWWYQNGIFHVEAWTRTLWLPGVCGGENALIGCVGCIPKSVYKKDIEKLVGLLFQPLPVQGEMTWGQGGVQQMPNVHAAIPQSGGVIYVQGTNTDKYAVIALVCALVGVVLAIPVCWMGFLFGGLGNVYGRKGVKSSKRGMANAGFAIGIVALVLSVLGFLFYLFLLFI